MSILLSAYYPEGIVFAADKNETQPGLVPLLNTVTPTATKVLSWPANKAVAGFVGLGKMGDLYVDDWMKAIVQETVNFENAEEIAQKLRSRIETEFSKYHPESEDIPENHIIIIHIGGFVLKDGVHTPVMYQIQNFDDARSRIARYPAAKRHFNMIECIEEFFRSKNSLSYYPSRIKDALVDPRVVGLTYLGYSDGTDFAFFDEIRAGLWIELQSACKAGHARKLSGIIGRVAYCNWAIETYGAFFNTHYHPPSREVGGGSDAVYIPWPE